jgi:hypothetical protein
LISKQLKEVQDRSIVRPIDETTQLIIPALVNGQIMSNNGAILQWISGLTATNYNGTISAGTDACKAAVPAVNDIFIATDTKRIYICFVAGTWSITNHEFGTDASKAATPAVGNFFFATDTKKRYFCFTAGAWTDLIDKVSAQTIAGAKTLSDLLTVNANIKWPATQVPSADANTLDDYEEGLWTPDLQFGGAKVGITYGTQIGTYTKIGNTISLRADIVLTSKGTSVGQADIHGLPFANAANGVSVSLYFATISYANVFQGILASGASLINLQEITEGGGVSTITNTNFANTSRVAMFIVYNV